MTLQTPASMQPRKNHPETECECLHRFQDTILRFYIDVDNRPLYDFRCQSHMVIYQSQEGLQSRQDS